MRPHFSSSGFSTRAAAQALRWVALAPLAVLGGCNQYDLGDLIDAIDDGGHGQHDTNECHSDDECPVPPCACLDENGDGICENQCPFPVCRDGVCGLSNAGVLQLGDACGGFRPPGSPECDTGLFCQHQPGALCGAADAPGECVLIPQACEDSFAPVCGCDGGTYGNACEAAANLAGILDLGPCEASCPESCPVILICRLCDDGRCADAQVSCNADGSCGEVSFVCAD